MNLKKLTTERVFILILGYIINIPSFLTKNECINVEGKSTTFIDLAKSPHKEDYIESEVLSQKGSGKELLETVMTSEIVGVSDMYKRIIINPGREAFFTYDFYKESPILPVKVSRKTRPLLVAFKLYDYEGECYIQVYYAVDKANEYYTAVYKYSDVDIDKVKELSLSI